MAPGNVEIRVAQFTPKGTFPVPGKELEMPKWTEHLDRILSVLTVILAAGELEHLVQPWVVLLFAVLTAISEWVKPTAPVFPTIPTGTPPHSPPEPKPQKGK